MSPLLAQSGHALLHRTCPLLGAKRTWPNRLGIYPLHDLSFSIVARLTCGRFYKRALADRFCLRIKCDFNHIRVRSFILTGPPTMPPTFGLLPKDDGQPRLQAKLIMD